jgi:hypothetical protein
MRGSPFPIRETPIHDSIQEVYPAKAAAGWKWCIIAMCRSGFSQPLFFVSLPGTELAAAHLPDRFRTDVPTVTFLRNERV